MIRDWLQSGIQLKVVLISYACFKVDQIHTTHEMTTTNQQQQHDPMQTFTKQTVKV